jgi:hypothetical protein
MGTPASTSTWSDINFLQRNTYYRPNRKILTQTFFAGQLYPITLLVANGAGDAMLQLSITTPAGIVVTDTTGYFLQPTCGAISIPTATNQPTQTGVIDDINFGVPNPGTSATVYGHGPHDVMASCTFIRGYLVANVTRSHTFSLNQPDDVGFTWLGPTVISVWTAANLQIRGATVASASGL